jgi:hypothetical protein
MLLMKLQAIALALAFGIQSGRSGYPKFRVGLFGLFKISGICKRYPKSGIWEHYPKFRVPENFGFGFG